MSYPGQYHQYSGQHRAYRQPIITTSSKPSGRSRGHTTSPTVGATDTHTTSGEPSARSCGYTTFPTADATDTHITSGEPYVQPRGYTTFQTVGASNVHTSPGEPTARSRSHTTSPNTRTPDTHTVRIQLPQAGESPTYSRSHATSPLVGTLGTYTTGTIPDYSRDATVGTQTLASAPLLSGIQPGSQSHSSTASGGMPEDLTNYVSKDEKYPTAHGGFGEIWKCTYKRDRKVTKVAVKTLTVYTSDQPVEREKKNKKITRELRTCAQLQHKHILPICGYTHGFSPLIAIVSHWAENGDLTTYLERPENLGAGLSLVRRFQILRDITHGLQYLHANKVIHADLKGHNVLIYADGTACLADFGLSVMLASISQASYNSAIKGTLRWVAPELLEQREGGSMVLPTNQSDVYSFGGVMLQVLSNKIPYHYLSDLAVMRPIINLQKPSRSYYPTVVDKHWHFIDECWSADPEMRPSTGRVVDVIKDELRRASASQGSRGDRNVNPEMAVTLGPVNHGRATR